jgi:hypothetical protein
MHDEIKQELYDALNSLSREDLTAENSGICILVRNRLNVIRGYTYENCVPHMKALHELFNSWELFSGSRSYPIKHRKSTPLEAYRRSRKPWSTKTEYGRSRHKLLQHCIKRLREELQCE